MKHNGMYKLETERLYLRPFTMDDAEAMFVWCSDPVVTHYMPWPIHESVADTAAVLADWLEAYKSGRRYEWCIVEKATGHVVGSIGATSIDDENEVVEVGYILARAHWGKGIVPEATKAVIRFFFDQVGAKRVIAKFDSENANSGRVMQKCGMTFLEERVGGLTNKLGVRNGIVYKIDK